jgi:hypothetical protein
MSPYTGLGGNAEVYLDNKGKLPLVVKNSIRILFNYGCDYHADKDVLMFGIEPTYQYERLYIFSINKDINKSYVLRGKAWGSYGTDIVKTIKNYSDYKYKSKLVKFIKEIHNFYFT